MTVERFSNASASVPGAANIDVDTASVELIVISTIFLVLMIIGLVVNIVVFLTYVRTPRLQTPTNVFIIGCVICDITMLAIGFPFVIASGYNGWWLFGDVWCKVYGFVTTLIGVSSVAMLTAVAMDRYFMILEKPFSARITVSKAWVTVAACYMYGLLWAMFPLFGWSGYVLEHSKISCGPYWHSREPEARTYNISIFTFVFLVPICIIAYCYFHILHHVSIT